MVRCCKLSAFRGAICDRFEVLDCNDFFGVATHASFAWFVCGIVYYEFLIGPWHFHHQMLTSPRPPRAHTPGFQGSSPMRTTIVQSLPTVLDRHWQKAQRMRMLWWTVAGMHFLVSCTLCWRQQRPRPTYPSCFFVVFSVAGSCWLFSSSSLMWRMGRKVRQSVCSSWEISMCKANGIHGTELQTDVEWETSILIKEWIIQGQTHFPALGVGQIVFLNNCTTSANVRSFLYIPCQRSLVRDPVMLDPMVLRRVWLCLTQRFGI